MFSIFTLKEKARPDNAVGSMADCKFRGRLFESRPGHTTFVEIGHEIIFKAIPSFR